MRGWRAWTRPRGGSATRPLSRRREGGENHEKHEIHERDNNRTTNGESREKGEERRR